MNIAIPSALPGLDSDIAPQLQTGKYILIIDIATMDYHAITNSFGAGKSESAREHLIRNLLENNVLTVVTNHCGHRFRESLANAGIETIDVDSHTVAQALQKLLELSKAETLILPAGPFLQ